MNHVKILSGNSKLVRARVEGSDTYQVNLFRSKDQMNASCTCPYMDRYDGACKHIWATILQAEKQGFLKGDNNQTIKKLQIFDTNQDDEFEEYDTPYEVKISPPTATTPISPIPPRPARAILSPRQAIGWKQALSHFNEKVNPHPTIASALLDPGHAIFYIVDLLRSRANKHLLIELTTRYHLKSGQWSEPRNWSLPRHSLDRVEDLPDRQTLQALAKVREESDQAQYYNPYHRSKISTRYELPHPLGATLLPLVCATGRCVLRETENNDSLQKLHWDGPDFWEFWLKVAPSESGKSYELLGELRRGEQRLGLEATRLILRGGLVFWEDRVAPLEDANCFEWIEMLLRQKKVPVPLGQKEHFLKQLLQLRNLPRLDLPQDMRFEEVALTPRPFLKIQRQTERFRNRDRKQEMLAGELAFEYGQHVISAQSNLPGIYEADSRKFIPRDRVSEQSYAAKTLEVGFLRHRDASQREVQLISASQLPEAVNTLLREGWRVEAQGKLCRPAGSYQVDLRSGIDWFELHGKVSFGEHEVAFPLLIAALERGENFVPLGDGSCGLLPEEWLNKYLPLARMGTTEGDHVRFRQTQVGLLDAMLAMQSEVSIDKRFEQARERLRQFQGIAPHEAPNGFTGDLRVYQQEGLGWLHFLREFGFGGCLADDMGLGKTIQVLALLEARRQLRCNARKKNRLPPSLVVVPRSLIFNWQSEASRFTPKLRILDNSGLGRIKSTDQFENYDVILTTYGTLRRDILTLKDYKFDYAILDEAQAIKNGNSLSAKSARLINADHRLAMSGTPVENHLGELWSLFEFLNPGMLGNTSQMGKSDLGLGKSNEEGTAILAKALRPFILRRTKEQVAKDLPEKTEQTIYCDLDPDQRMLYDDLREHYRSSLLGRIARDGINKSKILILEALLRLRQAALHPGLIDKAEQFNTSSAKLEVLLEQLREVFQEGHKTLVFSQFTSMLAIVKHRLDKEKIPYAYLDGQTKDRQERVQQFQNDPDCKVFLISLKAGGVGLNLTAADYIFLLDPWWNPAVESQAIDRAHRIGQTRPVFAYRLIARNTVEEKVLELQSKKRALADAIINADNSLIRNLGREDLELLLS